MTMTIQLSVSGETPSELITNLQAVVTALAAPGSETPRKGRPPKTVSEAGTGAATTAPVTEGDPLAGIAGKGNGQSGSDIFEDEKPAAAPAFKTPEDFIAAVKQLLGKGKDDAVKIKLKELGFEKVRDVPPERYTATLTELGKV
jgi:hypothetical protein